MVCHSFVDGARYWIYIRSRLCQPGLNQTMTATMPTEIENIYLYMYVIFNAIILAFITSLQVSATNRTRAAEINMTNICQAIQDISNKIFKGLLGWVWYWWIYADWSVKLFGNRKLPANEQEQQQKNKCLLYYFGSAKKKKKKWYYPVSVVVVVEVMKWNGVAFIYWGSISEFYSFFAFLFFWNLVLFLFFGLEMHGIGEIGQVLDVLWRE